MVYQGKPSAGCANCRKRKIKCDEATPACGQCVNTKRECPGYVARFDLVLRDQTKAVRRKAQRRKQAESGGSSSKGAASEKEQRDSQDALSLEELYSTGSSRHVLDGSGKWVLTKRRSTSPGSRLPRIWNEFPEQQAICAFFLDFVLLPRHPDSVRGHLEHLEPLYQKTSPDSPLSLATSSIALAISGNSNLRPADHHLARTTFGKALQKTSVAIRDPVQSIKDETLMAVLLLGLYERINATSESSKPGMASTHNAGAAALVKHRGFANCKSQLAVGLLFAVRTQLVEHAIEQGQAFKRCPDGLSAIFKSLPQNAAARLTSATINIADLRACARTALATPRSLAADKEVNDLLEYAISIDLLVGAWPQSVPEDWAWCRATGLNTPAYQPRDAYIYTVNNERMDTYLDLWVLSIWNQYRAARLKIQAIILDCIAYLGPDHEAQWYWRSVYATMLAQEMADDICASVPFALGTRTMGGPGTSEGIEFPYNSSAPSSSTNTGNQQQQFIQSASPEHRRASSAMGGWHLLDPLKAMLKMDRSVLRKGQQTWAAEQMERIGRIYYMGAQRGMGVAAASGAMPPPMMAGGAPERGMFERSSYEFPM